MVKKNKTKILSLLSMMFIAAGLIFTESTLPQSAPSNYPAGKPIIMIVPWPPGGATDVTARALAAGLEKEIKTSIQIVNKAGANSQVGMTAVLTSKPDGYTLGFVSLPTCVTHYLDPSREVPYTRKNFEPIANQWQAPFTMIVGVNSPYKSVKDLVEAARANPNKITMADTGLLGTPHLTVLQIEKASGVKFASVHFDGDARVMTALLGGHVQAAILSGPAAATNVKSGVARALGVADERESEFLPGVKTMMSLGYNVVSVNSGGVVAPAGTSKEIVEFLSKAIGKVIESDEHKQLLAKFNCSQAYMNPEKFTQLWVDYENRFGPILKAAREANL
jgi:tripartite-type tricarboxylate transporter receptor subunit TctC